MWMPVAMGLMALGSFGVAARGLATNRPFMYSPRWFLALIAAVFCTNFALVLRDSTGDPSAGGTPIAALVLPGLLALMSLLVLFQLRGYLAVGITGPLFREALFVSIKKLGLPFEQRFSVVSLPSVPTEFRMSVQNLTGTAQIKLRRVRGRGALRDIARGMNGYFNSRKIAASSISCIYYFALAVTFTIMAVEVWPK